MKKSSTVSFADAFWLTVTTTAVHSESTCLPRDFIRRGANSAAGSNKNKDLKMWILFLKCPPAAAPSYSFLQRNHLYSNTLFSNLWVESICLCKNITTQEHELLYFSLYYKICILKSKN